MYEYIIIGGGISGINVANKLKDKKILVLEKQNRLGGRIYSKKIDNNWIEFGAKWIHGKPPNFINNYEYIYEPYIKTIIQKFTIVDFEYTEKEIIQLFKKVKFIPYMYKNLCEDFKKQSLNEREIKLLDIILSEDYGEHICLLSSTNHYYKNYGKHRRVINGMKQIIDNNFDYKFDYKLNQEVIKIENRKVYTKDKIYETEKIILAVPLNILKNEFSYLLSPKKNKILKKMKMGQIKVFVMIFDNIFWNKKITYWFSQKFNNIVLINGLNNVLYFHEYSSKNITKYNITKYLKYFIKDAIKPNKILEQDWNKESGGSWTYHVSNISKKDIYFLQKPENNIYLVGEYMSKDRIGTIDGAYNSSNYIND